MPVQKGNVLLVPANVDASHMATVHWEQSLHQKSAQYYSIIAADKSQGNAEVVIFIAAEWYEGEGGPGEHISHIAHKDAQGFYEVTIDDRFQYGQKNKNGDARFVVYHDKGRKQYQHRFIESGLTSVGTEVAVKIAGVFGYGAEANIAKVVGEGMLGDYLHTF